MIDCDCKADNSLQNEWHEEMKGAEVAIKCLEREGVNVIFVLYIGWGSFLVIEDFANKSWKAPMYVINFRDGRDRLLSCFIAFLKIIFWPFVYLLKLI